MTDDIAAGADEQPGDPGPWPYGGPPPPVPAAGAGRSRRRLVALAVAGLLVLGSVGYVLWPGGSGRSANGNAAAHATAAAQALSVLPAVQLSMVYDPGQDGTLTQADLTVTAAGQATGTLHEPDAGSSDLAWNAGQLYLKGDAAFWGTQSPLYDFDVSASGHWVAPQKRDGYYLLDNFAVDVGTLTPASLGSLVKQVTSDPTAVRGDAGSFGGRPATSYTAGDWTVLVASTAPYTVLGIGGTPHDSGPVRSAAWTAPVHSTKVVDAGFRSSVLPTDDPGTGDPAGPPSLFFVPAPACPAEAAAVPPAVAGASSTAVPSGTAGSSDPTGTGTAQGAAFSATQTSGTDCSTPSCPMTFEVTNTGDQPADATLYVSAPGFPETPFPLGTIAPGDSRQASASRPNQAPPGQTVSVTVSTWVYSSALYGQDPAVPQRLRARNLNPDDQAEVSSVATPLRAAAVNLLDQMTQNTPASNTEANTAALKALDSANTRGLLPLLSTITSSGRLQNPDDLRTIIPKAIAPTDVREMEQVAHLLQTDPTAKVWYDGPYIVDGTRYQADYIYTGTENGQPVKRAVQIKTLTSYKNLGTNVRKGANQLNGKAGGPNGDDTLAEKAPPGFERVLQLYLEPSFGYLAMSNQADLENWIQSRAFRQSRQNLCDPGGGGLLVDRLVIINGTGLHTWTDLGKLGIHC